MIKLAFRLAATSLMALCVAVPTSFATTPAGSVIRNQAEATYFDPSLNRSFVVSSTIATVRVRSAPDFELRLEGERLASPGERVVFPHQLQNTGNEADVYALTLLSPDGVSALEDAAIFIDLNGNGMIEADEPEITETGILQPDQTVALLVAGNVPTAATSGQSYAALLRATSTADDSNVQTVMDTATVSSRQRLQITKTALPTCSVPIQPGSVIDYSIDMLYLDDLTAYSRQYQIDGQSVSGYVIEDTIPANTTLIAGENLTVAPQTALPIIRDAGAISDSFRSYSNYRESDLVSSFGLFLPASALSSNQSGEFNFKVRVSSSITPGTVITNAVAVDLDGDGSSDVLSNPTCNTVDPMGADATLRFLEPALPVRQEITAAAAGSNRKVAENSSGLFGPRHPIDTDYADAPVYRMDTYPGYILARDGVYLEARSTALNTSSSIQETRFSERFIRVEIESRTTGDKLNVRLLETGPNTGTFRALVPFRLSVTESGSGRDCDSTLQAQCVLRSVSGDRLRATIYDPGTDRNLIDAAVVDPQGMVFDSTTLEPVEGATVSILAADGSVARDPDTLAPLGPQTTATGGMFTIPLLEDGQYSLSITPIEGYTFPSIVAPSVFAGRLEVSEASYGVDGYDGASSGLFDASFANTPPVIDVPIDPDLAQGQLGLEKSVNREIVTYGDTLTYTLTVSNNTGARLDDIVIVDTPPAGLRFVEDSARLNGDPLAIVHGPAPRDLSFEVGSLEVTTEATVTYNLQVGPEARTGKLENTAVATGISSGFVPARSLTARESVTLTDEGLLSDRAYLIGSVWADANDNGLRDKDEIGLPGARVWLEDGTWVETDELGRYSLYGLQPGLRIARIDEKTLPAGYTPTKDAPRASLSGRMRFVDLTAGDFHRADFPLTCPEGEACGRDSAFAKTAGERAARLSPDAMLDQALAYEGLLGETRGSAITRRREQPGTDGDISNGVISLSGAPGLNAAERLTTLAMRGGEAGTETVDGVTSSAPDSAIGDGVSNDAGLDPETAAATLGRVDVKTGAWLWPLPDATSGRRYVRDGRVMVAIRSGIDPILYVDGVAIPSENLGALVENREQGATVAAWYGVNFDTGPHDVEVRGVDMFGNERVLSEAALIRPGKAETLIIETPLERVAADGRSKAQLTLRALDALSAPSMGTQFITVEASIPGTDTRIRFDGEDVQPTEPGHQIRLRDGAAIINVIAPETSGEVTVTATDQGALKAQTKIRFAAETRDLIAVGIVSVTGQQFDLSGQLEPADEDLFPTSMEIDGRTAVFLKGQIKGGALLTFAYDSEKSSNGGLFRDIDPEAYYPIYGDASEKGYEAQSRSKLYVRIEKGDSAIMWGDFRTDAYGEENLVRTRRSLTGVNASTRKGAWEMSGFAAETSRQQRSERIRGRALALDITLPGAPLVDGSEVLTVEIRDRNNPGLLVSEETLTRFADYVLDDDTGRLVLKSPLGSIDEFGNPIFLLATYESEDEVSDAVVAGVRARRDGETTSLWGGVTYDEAQADGDSRTYASIGGEVRSSLGRVYAEVGVSQNETQDIENTGGEAFRLGVASSILGGEVTAEYAQADTDFVNTDAPIFAGRREARAGYQAALNESVSMNVAGTYSEDMDSEAARSVLDAQVSAQLGEWALGLGPRLTQQDDGDEAIDYVSVVARAQRSFELAGRAATGGVEIERAMDENRTRITVTGDYMVRDDTRIYATHRLLDELPDQTFAQGLTSNLQGVGQQQTVFGVESRFLPNTDLYGEWREDGALDSRTGEAAYGLRSQWDIVEGLSIAPQFEYVQTFDNGNTVDENAVQNGDAMALSLGIADRRFENSRRSARIEGRQSETSTFLSTRIGWAERFTPTLTGAVKLDAARDNIVNADDIERIRLTLGTAYRPADADKPDVIALYQWLSEQEAGQTRTAHIVSTHANRQYGTDWTVSGRAVAKWEDNAGNETSAQLLGARVVRNITKDFDFEVRGAVRAVQWGDAYQESIGVAGIWQPRDDVQLTLGYNFTGFRDRDLDPNGYDAQGIYWGIAVAVDEDWFGWLRPDALKGPDFVPYDDVMSTAKANGSDVRTVSKPPVVTPNPQPVIRPIVKAAPVATPVRIVQPEKVTCQSAATNRSIYFDWDSAELGTAANNTLDEVAQRAKSQPDCVTASTVVIGHTDTSGSAEYNTLL